MADDDELAESIAELTRALRDLRRELRSEPDRRRPRLRPPSPRELLRMTDEVAIPAVIAVLEANVRALEAFQRGLRLVRREREVRDRAMDANERTRDRASELRSTTLEQLDSVLAELQRAASEGSIPRDGGDGGTADLIEEARQLRDDVDRRLREATDRAGSADSSDLDGRTIPIEDGSSETDDGGTEAADEDEGAPDSGVDVDAELETLRDRYRRDEPEAEDANGDEAPEGDGNTAEESDSDGDDSDENGDRPGEG